MNSVYIHLGDAQRGDVKTLGPFEFVQLTYGHIVRVGLGGDEDDHIGSFNDAGDFLLSNDNTTWSDLTISSANGDTVVARKPR